MHTRSSPPGPQQPSRRVRRTLVGSAVGIVLLHAYHARFQGGGGWYERHDGLGGAIWKFFTVSAGDPVLSAGLSDFAAVATLLGAWMVAELPEAERRRFRTKVWLGIYTIFPGLGGPLYFIWLNPRHRFVTGR